jgi:hypothetical protein
LRFVDGGVDVGGYLHSFTMFEKGGHSPFLSPVSLVAVFCQKSTAGLKFLRLCQVAIQLSIGLDC